MTTKNLITIGYHCSHEQYPPSHLLRNVKRAAEGGFKAAMCSDHFHPWSHRQAGNGFAWSWLGSALEATNLSLGTVCAPGQRYHPAIIAQAAATLAEMYPDRFWLAVGSGEALNEHITGDPWLPKSERNHRLEESVGVMRALWAGETVNHKGLVKVKDAKLHSRPAKPPLVIGACLSTETAKWLGGWADGMVTVSQEPAQLKKIVDAFREGGGAAKPMFLQVVMSYANTENEALQAAYDQWRFSALQGQERANLETPAAFDAASAESRPDDMRRAVRVSPSTEQHMEWLTKDKELGFERLYLHNIHQDQERFIAVFGEKVLPAFNRG